jgi:hypothetical protein
MKIQIGHFHSRLASLREFVEFVAPVLDEKDNVASENLHDILSCSLLLLRIMGMTADDIRSGLQAELQKKRRLVNDLQNIEDLLFSANKMFEEETGSSVPLPGEDERKSALFKKYSERIKADSETLASVGDISTKKRHLYESSLVSLITTIDWFLAEILRSHLLKYPQTDGASEKTYSLRDIIGFADIDEALRWAVDQKVDARMRSGLEDVFLYFGKLKYDLEIISEQIPELIEADQRRNILVHADGVVNGIYMQRVSEELRKNVEVGQKLSVERDYLQARIQAAETALTLLALEAWHAIDAKSNERGEQILRLSFEYLVGKKYQQCLCVSEYGANRANLSEDRGLTCRVNYWLARKSLNGFDSVRSEVENSDFSGKAPRFQMAQAAILENREKFYEKLPAALADISSEPDGKLQALEKFPLFDPFREDERFGSILTECGKTNASVPPALTSGSGY